MDIVSGDEIPMYPIGHNNKDLAHMLGESVGSGLKSGARWLYDHPATVAGVVGAGLVGGALAPELAGMGGVAAGAEALGIVEEGALTGGEIASALGGLGVSAGAA